MRGGADSPSSDKVEIACGDCGARYLVPVGRVRDRVFRFTCRRCERLVVARCEGDAVVRVDESALSTPSTAAGAHDAPVAEAEDQTDYAEPQADTSGAWYVALDGEPHGPIGLSELVALLQQQRIDSEAQVWSPTGSGWQRLAAVPVLRELLGQSQSTRFYQPGERSTPTVSDGATAYWRAGAAPPAEGLRPTTVELSAAAAAPSASHARGAEASTAVAAALPLAHTIELASSDSALAEVVSQRRVGTQGEPRAARPRGAERVDPGSATTPSADPLLATHAYEPEEDSARLPLERLRPAAGSGSEGGALDSASYRLAQAVEHAGEWGREIDPRWGVSPGRVGTLRGSLREGRDRGTAGAAGRAAAGAGVARGWSAVRAQPSVGLEEDGEPAAELRRTAPEHRGGRGRVPPTGPRSDRRIALDADTADDPARFDDFARPFAVDDGVVASARLPTGYRGAVVAKIPGGGARTGAPAFAPVFAPALPPAGRVTLAPNLLLPLRPRFWSARRAAVAVAGAIAALLVVGGVTLAYLLTRGPAPRSTRSLTSPMPPPRAGEARTPVPPALPAATTATAAPPATAPAVSPRADAARPALAATNRPAPATSPSASPPAAAPPAAAPHPASAARAPTRRATRSQPAPRPQPAPRATANPRTAARRVGRNADLSPELEVGLPATAARRPSAAATRRVDVDELLSVGSGGAQRPKDRSRGETAPPDSAAGETAGDGDGDADLPRTLTKAQVAAVMRQLRERVRGCLDKHHQPGRLSLRIAIQPYGRASGEVVEELAGTATASCAERALTALRFPRFTGEVIRFSYAFDLE